MSLVLERCCAKSDHARLYEVDVVRPILILLLVIYHSFAVYDGKWQLFEGYSDNLVYKVISKVAYGGALETFVFISGYVWGFQIVSTNRKLHFGDFILHKAKRLLVPSILFSVIYLLLFSKDHFFNCYLIIIGAGHLWFLPMLFSCFVICYILQWVKIKTLWKFILLFILSLFSFMPLPLNLSKVFYYCLFFYLGYKTINKKYLIIKKANILQIVAIWIVSLLLWLLCIHLGNMNIHKVCFHLFSKLFQILFAISFIIGFMMSSFYYTERHDIPGSLTMMCSYCYGVYICHQFVLQLLYYKTSAPVLLGPRVLPWVGLFAALIVSLSFTYLFRSSKLGRFLIG